MEVLSIYHPLRTTGILAYRRRAVSPVEDPKNIGHSTEYDSKQQYENSFFSTIVTSAPVDTRQCSSRTIGSLIDIIA